MATITFKVKIKEAISADDVLLYRYFNVPVFKQSHCDMNEFRKHPKYGSYANSTLFPAILARLRRELFKNNFEVNIDNPLPDNVTINLSGFLAEVTIKV